MLLDQIKARMFAAMKSGHALEKEILRVAVGEITTDAAREGRKGNDEEAQAILRKLVKSNEESIASLSDPAKRAQLEEENRILASFMPRALGVDDIVVLLAPVGDAIKSAGNEGQATGVAMKHLKSTGSVVNGKDVAAAVKTIRG